MVSIVVRGLAAGAVTNSLIDGFGASPGERPGPTLFSSAGAGSVKVASSVGIVRDAGLGLVEAEDGNGAGFGPGVSTLGLGIAAASFARGSKGSDEASSFGGAAPTAGGGGTASSFASAGEGIAFVGDSGGAGGLSTVC